MIEISNIIFFDGMCNFCNSTVDFFYSKNHTKTIFYASLQSEFTKSFLPKKYLQKEDFDTIYYYSNGVFYSKSTAVLQALKETNGIYKLLSIFIIIPSIIRDAVYSFIAKRRHKIFGSSDTCRLPSKEEKKYFLEKELDLTKCKLNCPPRYRTINL
jgi:predicted DCC family thiol-disulfide oxidoreductase YuxK